jgi:hypothetical protein
VPWGARVREATASVRRTPLAGVRRKSTKLAASPVSGTVTHEERYPLGLLVPYPLGLLVPFPLLFSE